MRVRKAVIPAAGFGTRLLPATKAVPKEMLPVVDVPLIQYAVEEAARAGVTDVCLVTSAGKASMEDHFDRAPVLEAALEAKGDGATLQRVIGTASGTRICAVRQSQALGLGHAVGCASAFVGAEPFAVLLPDEIFPAPGRLLEDLIAAYERTRASVVAVMDVPRDDIRRYGAVDPEPVSDGFVRMRDFVEKPHPDDAPSTLAAIGRYVLTPDVMEAIASTEPGAGGEIQLTDAIRAVARAGEAYAVVFEGRRYDAGNALGLLKASVELALEREDIGPAFRDFLAGLNSASSPP